MEEEAKEQAADAGQEEATEPKDASRQDAEENAAPQADGSTAQQSGQPATHTMPTLSLRPLQRLPPQCQVCSLDLSGHKGYYQRYRICETHLQLQSIPLDGVVSRFCQQCGKFQPITDFDGSRRSCRSQLKRHNARRRRRHALQRKAIGSGGRAGDYSSGEGSSGDDGEGAEPSPRGGAGSGGAGAADGGAAGIAGAAGGGGGSDTGVGAGIESGLGTKRPRPPRTHSVTSTSHLPGGSGLVGSGSLLPSGLTAAQASAGLAGGPLPGGLQPAELLLAASGGIRAATAAEVLGQQAGLGGPGSAAWAAAAAGDALRSQQLQQHALGMGLPLGMSSALLQQGLLPGGGAGAHLSGLGGPGSLLDIGSASAAELGLGLGFGGLGQQGSQLAALQSMGLGHSGLAHAQAQAHVHAVQQAAIADELMAMQRRLLGAPSALTQQQVALVDALAMQQQRQGLGPGRAGLTGTSVLSSPRRGGPLHMGPDDTSGMAALAAAAVASQQQQQAESEQQQQQQQKQQQLAQDAGGMQGLEGPGADSNHQHNLQQQQQQQQVLEIRPSQGNGQQAGADAAPAGQTPAAPTTGAAAPAGLGILAAPSTAAGGAQAAAAAVRAAAMEILGAGSSVVLDEGLVLLAAPDQQLMLAVPQPGTGQMLLLPVSQQGALVRLPQEGVEAQAKPQQQQQLQQTQQQQGVDGVASVAPTQGDAAAAAATAADGASGQGCKAEQGEGAAGAVADGGAEPGAAAAGAGAQAAGQAEGQQGKEHGQSVLTCRPSGDKQAEAPPGGQQPHSQGAPAGSGAPATAASEQGGHGASQGGAATGGGGGGAEGKRTSTAAATTKAIAPKEEAVPAGEVGPGAHAAPAQAMPAQGHEHANGTDPAAPGPAQQTQLLSPPQQQQQLLLLQQGKQAFADGQLQVQPMQPVQLHSTPMQQQAQQLMRLQALPNGAGPAGAMDPAGEQQVYVPGIGVVPMSALSQMMGPQQQQQGPPQVLLQPAAHPQPMQLQQLRMSGPGGLMQPQQLLGGPGSMYLPTQQGLALQQAAGGPQVLQQQLGPGGWSMARMAPPGAMGPGGPLPLMLQQGSPGVQQLLLGGDPSAGAALQAPPGAAYMMASQPGHQGLVFAGQEQAAPGQRYVLLSPPDMGLGGPRGQ